MRKRVFGKKLSQTMRGREALFRSLARALVLNGAIKTTQAKAKAVQPWIDKLVSKAQEEDLAARRHILRQLGGATQAVDKLFKEIAPRFSGITSGFTRAVPLPKRWGDSAPLVRLEWTKQAERQDAKSKKPKRKKGSKTRADKKAKKR